MQLAVVKALEWQFWIVDDSGEDLLDVDAPEGACAWHAADDVPLAVVVNTGLSWGPVKVSLASEWSDDHTGWDEVSEFSVHSASGLGVSSMDGGPIVLSLTNSGGVHRVQLRIRGQDIGRDNEEGGPADGVPCEQYQFSVHAEQTMRPGQLIIASTALD